MHLSLGPDRLMRYEQRAKRAVAKSLGVTKEAARLDEKFGLGTGDAYTVSYYNLRCSTRSLGIGVLPTSANGLIFHFRMVFFIPSTALGSILSFLFLLRYSHWNGKVQRTKRAAYKAAHPKRK